MTSPAQLALRCGFYLLIFLACALLSAQQPTVARGFSERGSSDDACVRYPQRHLVIGGDLQSRRFILEPRGDLQLMPVFHVAEGRSIFHRPFSLSLDVGGKVALFMGGAQKTCVLARDGEPSQAMRIPVFFVGRAEESLEELKDDARVLVFDRSEALEAGAPFSDISFHLRRGGSHFDAIQPFFLCGLPGLLICEGSCPADWDILAASLVNQIVKDAQSLGHDEANAPPPQESRRPATNPPPPPFRSQPAPRILASANSAA